MVTEFNGFSKGVIGKKLPSDTTLNNMKKADLIELLHLAQHNYESLMWFYNNAVNVNMQKLEGMNILAIRNSTIDGFVAEAMKRFTDFDLKHGYPTVADCKIILEDVAKQMKGL